MLYPLSTTADLLTSPQLEYRNFWIDVEHPELGTTIQYPGTWAVNSETTPRISRRAPLIGEHNHEIYKSELGLSAEELEKLAHKGIL